MRILTFLSFVSLMVLTACVEDYDIAEVAPAEHLESGEHAGHDHEDGESCEESAHTGDEDGADIHSEMHDEHAGGPSGHAHAAGNRNHGTQWFFNQPWAAPFIWGKLARDGAVFLALAAVLFFVTGRRKR